jgi:uncharacterized protein YchJ
LRPIEFFFARTDASAVVLLNRQSDIEIAIVHGFDTYRKKKFLLCRSERISNIVILVMEHQCRGMNTEMVNGRLISRTIKSAARISRVGSDAVRAFARKGMLAEKFEENEDGGSDEAVGAEKNECCACGSDLMYRNCCESLHENGIEKTTLAEDVVRARFSAYREQKWKFICDSTHDGAEDFAIRGGGVLARERLEKDAEQTGTKIRFLSLRINASVVKDDFAYVTYECGFDAGEKKTKKSRAKAKTLIERAKYERDEEGKWKYVSALKLSDVELNAEKEFQDDGGFNRGKSGWGNGNLGKIF